MTESIEELGPVDYLVVEFPGSNFNGEILPELVGELRELERELADLLSEDDVAAAAAALEPGSTAALLVYENRWAAGFAGAVRRSGGQLVASGRIPFEAVVAAIGSIEDAVQDAPQQV